MSAVHAALGLDLTHFIRRALCLRVGSIRAAAANFVGSNSDSVEPSILHLRSNVVQWSLARSAFHCLISRQTGTPLSASLSNSTIWLSLYFDLPHDRS